MEIVVECPCLFFVSKIRANTAKHLLEKMLEMGNAKGNWPMNNRLNFFKRLTAFLLAMLLVTTMMGDDFFSLATSDEIITEESVETGDSSSAPEAAPAPEAVDIPHESAAEEQQNKLMQRQQNLQNDAAKKDAEIQEEQAVLNNQVYFAVKEFIERYNAEHQYSLILTTSGVTNTVLNVNPGLDITSDVLKGLNEEYIKNRNNSPEE